MDGVASDGGGGSPRAVPVLRGCESATRRSDRAARTRRPRPAGAGAARSERPARGRRFRSAAVSLPALRRSDRRRRGRDAPKTAVHGRGDRVGTRAVRRAQAAGCGDPQARQPVADRRGDSDDGLGDAATVGARGGSGTHVGVRSSVSARLERSRAREPRGDDGGGARAAARDERGDHGRGIRRGDAGFVMEARRSTAPQRAPPSDVSAANRASRRPCDLARTPRRRRRSKEIAT